MRRTERPPAALLSLLVLLLLLFAAPAFAQEDEEEEEYEEESAFMGYLGRAGTNALGGMNGLITAPADPVAASIEPPEALGEGVGGHLLGFGAGMLQMDEQWEGVPSHWSIYLHVADVDAAVARAVELGGSCCVPAFDVPGVGRIARLDDPSGAGFYVMTPSPQG